MGEGKKKERGMEVKEEKQKERRKKGREGRRRPSL